MPYDRPVVAAEQVPEPTFSGSATASRMRCRGRSAATGNPWRGPHVVKIVMDIDGTPLGELSRAWDKIREDYRSSRNGEYDRRVLDCAARLAADPGGETAYVWTLGLAVMARYIAWLPGDNVIREATA